MNLHAIYLFFAVLGGAVAGSFLNMLVHRLPNLLALDEERAPPLRRILYGLAWPASHCPHCRAELRWRDNVPVLSYLWLKGCCRDCGTAIGIRYILVELVSVAVCVFAYLQFGWTVQAGFCAAFILVLIAFSVIDLAEGVLPDILIWPMLGLGLLFNAFYGSGLVDALFGLAVAFAAMWCIRAGYRLAAGREGMGYGDVKFAGMLGAWVGLEAAPFMLMAAFVGGLAVSLALLAAQKAARGAELPFGPYLSVSAIAFLAFPDLTETLTSLLTDA